MPIRIDVNDNGGWTVFRLSHGFHDYESVDKAARAIKEMMRAELAEWDRVQELRIQMETNPLSVGRAK